MKFRFNESPVLPSLYTQSVLMSSQHPRPTVIKGIIPYVEVIVPQNDVYLPHASWARRPIDPNPR